ncbi:ribosome biogenesis protein ytm1 [Microthyrium microscopicum]|uniref:Ribosome biogenesis protein YTM1 n=1 Tax=Microthyrium microscopicum TaxID=703497 RepID=A0A6A6UKR8_9PEZI|nr:ribosome biogenesis protein ytm1 [Microthyrium microscopicum]
MDKTAQIRIQLESRDPDVTIKLPENTGPILVSTGLRRIALSTLVNNLLENEKPIPFEFLINGQFLRTTIDEFLTANGISSEVTLSVEYVRALIPPSHVVSFEHEDWISAVDVVSQTSSVLLQDQDGTSSPIKDPRILSASYDGLIRMWSKSSDLLAVSKPTSGQPINAACFLTTSKIVSAGSDRVVRVWKYEENGVTGGSMQVSGTFTPILDLYGHRSSVDSISVHAPSSRILSGSSDHTVGLWSTRKSEGPQPPDSLLPSALPGAAKRRKLEQSAAFQPGPQRGPLSLLKRHTGPVSGAIFSAKDSTVGYSTSWDQTLVTWDLVTGAEVSTRRLLNPLLCVTEMPDLGLLATGTSARHIAMIDPRVDVRDVTGLTLRGHAGAIVSAAAEPEKPWGLVSASHDGTCRIWDLRSVRMDGKSASGLAVGGTGQVCESVYVIRRESIANDERKVAGDGIKVFSVFWDKEVGIGSAGEDKRVQIDQMVPR